MGMGGKRWRAFEAEDIDTLKRLHHLGYSARQIGIRMDRDSSVICQWKTKLGLPKPERRPPDWTPGRGNQVRPADVESIRRMLTEGKGTIEIAKTTGFTVETIRKYRLRMGFAPAERSKHATTPKPPLPPLVLYREPTLLPSEPTPAMPGTEEKIAVLEQRFLRRERLHHPYDARHLA